MYAVTGRRGKTLDEQGVFAVQTGFYADDADDGHSTQIFRFSFVSSIKTVYICNHSKSN